MGRPNIQLDMRDFLMADRGRCIAHPMNQSFKQRSLSGS
jgi:hypothetical protein